MGRRTEVLLLENQVRSRRQAIGLNQQVLATRCGLTRQAISAIEAGQYIPNTAVALRLARALNCAVEELFCLPADPSQVEAEWLGEMAAAGSERTRLLLARVGERLLAHPLIGPMATSTAADGLTVGTAPGQRSSTRRGVTVELLVDAQVLEHTVVVLGCDPALGLLGAHLTRRYPTLRLLWSHHSSLVALQMLGRGEAHAAGTHLWDPESGESNLPYIRRELPGRRLVVVTLSQWQQGLIVAHGNPKGITSVADLARPDVTLVNRDLGSGSRTLLDAWLRKAGLGPHQVGGYGREVPTHLAVAAAVASGRADAGPGILAVARLLGLDFVALQEERYDFVIPMEFLNTAPVQALLDITMSRPFQAELEALGGYDSSRAGTVVAELMS